MSKNQTERAKQISAQTLFTAFRLIITAKRAHSLLISILGNQRYNKCCFEYGLITTISIQSILWWAPCRIQSFIVLLLSSLIDKVDSNVFCNNYTPYGIKTNGIKTKHSQSVSKRTKSWSSDYQADEVTYFRVRYFYFCVPETSIFKLSSKFYVTPCAVDYSRHWHNCVTSLSVPKCN